ncbi:septal ring lytic transglycosylase RlpA family protein [Flavobacterium ardleyense]|uniref:septal ring lytic transglycosylase RlpA family protein n=1 Tax=Flavobacterium ardleyense TaxID=2038737 RepID=UPI00298BCDCA|nr:septal ring lytic transglycosylase RlpA family protein [Flavobacterium ardleyense]
MPKSGKQLVTLTILLCCIGLKSQAQTKTAQAKSVTEGKEIVVLIKVATTKKAVLTRSIGSAKTVAEPNVVDAKKVVELQKAALKEGLSNMSAVAESPLLPAVIVVDSVAILKNLKVKPYKVNSHASYYHDKLNGRRTASGKPFDNKKFTAAHRTFPFGTQLKLTNTINNKSVLVVVNDRGPFTKSREIDITKAAFMQIATNKNSGSVNITIEVVQ